MENDNTADPEGDWDVTDYMDEEFKNISEKFGVSIECAMDIFYLQTRSRWTEDLEKKLIRMDKAGEPRPNINEWPESNGG